MLDCQALGVVRLLLSKNVAYNIVNERTMFGLLKALYNIHEKHSTTNTTFLITQLVNLKMKEGSLVTDHVNKFNSIISRFISIDIGFEDEVMELLLLLLLLSWGDSWSGKMTTISSLTACAKLMFEGICDLILGEDVHRRSVEEAYNILLCTKDR